MESQSNSLFHRIRQNYDYFFLISLIFGLMGTILFHRAGMGLNSFLFTIIIVVLFIFITKKLNISFTKWVLFCLITSILLSLSNVLTSSWKLQFLNNIGILLLLDTSLIQLLSERKSLGFFDNIKNILLLPFKAISSIGLIFVEGNRFVKDKKIIKNDKFRNILIGCMIAIPLMIITTALLSSADMLYGKIAKYFLAHTDTNELESEDIYFLTTDLSYDAATLVVPLLEKHNDSKNLYQIDKYCKPLISDTKDIRDYNYSYMKAKKLLKDNLSFNKVD